jgi:hypothetical protein
MPSSTAVFSIMQQAIVVERGLWRMNSESSPGAADGAADGVANGGTAAGVGGGDSGGGGGAGAKGAVFDDLKMYVMATEGVGARATAEGDRAGETGRGVGAAAPVSASSSKEAYGVLSGAVGRQSMRPPPPPAFAVNTIIIDPREVLTHLRRSLDLGAPFVADSVNPLDSDDPALVMDATVAEAAADRAVAEEGEGGGNEDGVFTGFDEVLRGVQWQRVASLSWLGALGSTYWHGPDGGASFRSRRTSSAASRRPGNHFDAASASLRLSGRRDETKVGSPVGKVSTETKTAAFRSSDTSAFVHDTAPSRSTAFSPPPLLARRASSFYGEGAQMKVTAMKRLGDAGAGTHGADEPLMLADIAENGGDGSGGGGADGGGVGSSSSLSEYASSPAAMHRSITATTDMRGGWTGGMEGGDKDGGGGRGGAGGAAGGGAGKWFGHDGRISTAAIQTIIFALDDPDGTVRESATHAVAVVGEGDARHWRKVQAAQALSEQRRDIVVGRGGGQGEERGGGGGGGGGRGSMTDLVTGGGRGALGESQRSFFSGAEWRRHAAVLTAAAERLLSLTGDHNDDVRSLACRALGALAPSIVFRLTPRSGGPVSWPDSLRNAATANDGISAFPASPASQTGGDGGWGGARPSPGVFSLEGSATGGGASYASYISATSTGGGGQGGRSLLQQPRSAQRFDDGLVSSYRSNTEYTEYQDPPTMGPMDHSNNPNDDREWKGITDPLVAHQYHNQGQSPASLSRARSAPPSSLGGSRREQEGDGSGRRGPTRHAANGATPRVVGGSQSTQHGKTPGGGGGGAGGRSSKESAPSTPPLGSFRGDMPVKRPFGRSWAAGQRRANSGVSGGGSGSSTSTGDSTDGVWAEIGRLMAVRGMPIAVAAVIGRLRDDRYHVRFEATVAVGKWAVELGRHRQRSEGGGGGHGAGGGWGRRGGRWIR